MSTYKVVALEFKSDYCGNDGDNGNCPFDIAFTDKCPLSAAGGSKNVCHNQESYGRAIGDEQVKEARVVIVI